MTLSPTLTRCMDDLAARLDVAQEQRQLEQWQRFLSGELEQGYFTPTSREPSASGVDWPEIHANDNRVLHDPETMVLAQLGCVSGALAQGYNGPLGVRCNYGVSILTSQLGCRVIEMPDEQFNTPTTEALGGAVCSEAERLDAIKRCIDAGVPDVYAAQGGDALRTAELFEEVFERWPIIGQCVELYHPDTQGPMDNAELAWGSDIFLAFYDDPDLVHTFLELMTEHYITYLRKWYASVPTPPRDFLTHWNLMYTGRIVLRDDSLMNLSDEVYREFIRDREARCLRELGGGVIHFCGRGDHFIESMSALKADGLCGVQLSQPHLNQMETVYTHTVDAGIRLLMFDSGTAAQAIQDGRDLRGMLHSTEGGLAVPGATSASAAVA